MRNKVLVIAPHPDDEVIGVGGTIARFSNEGSEIFVVIVSKVDEELFKSVSVKISRDEALEAHKILGVKETFFLEGFLAAKIDTIPHYILNKELSRIVKDISPDICFCPFYGDIHKDHQLIFESTMVAVRPIPENHFPKVIYSYETLSETNWNAPYITPFFSPNVFIEISDFINKKIDALKAFKSQLKVFPHERSLESIMTLSKHRGSTVGIMHAEAFLLIREIL